MNTTSPQFTRWLRVVGGGAALLFAAWLTNPTHIQHVAKLLPGPVPADLVDWSKVDSAARRVTERNHPPTSHTRYHHGLFFSTTTNTLTGARDSFGMLGFVIDLRTEAQRAAERRAIDAEKLHAVVESFILDGTRALNGLQTLK